LPIIIFYIIKKNCFSKALGVGDRLVIGQITFAAQIKKSLINFQLYEKKK